MHLLKRIAPACLAALAAGLLAAAPVAAQQERQPAAGARAGSSDIYFPTGEEATSLLMIRAQAPEEVRVGQGYEYQLTVRNITDNVTLEDIRIQHESTDFVSIEGAQVGQQGQGQQGNAQQGQQGQARQREAQQGQQGQAQQAQDQAQQAQHDHGQQGQAQQAQDGNAVQIGELGPGQSRTVTIRAVAEQEGTAGVCFRVAYTPTVCLVTRFTQPEIQVIKAVPEVADICQPLRFEYTVRNTGTADVENVVVTDELPDGLQLEGGETTVRREVGNLPAGEAREFAVDLCAVRTGQFTSRAVAQSGDLRAQSNNPTTRIVAARLSAEMEGPDAQYLNQPATYRVTVRNEGDGPALDTRLEVDVDGRTRLIRTSRTSLNSVAPSQGDDRTLVWNIDRLEPGEETAVSFTVNLTRVPEAAEAQQAAANRDQQGQAQGQQAQNQSEGAQGYTFRHVAEVTSRCADAQMCADEEIRKYATAQAALEVELVTLPAMLLEMVDRFDQVTVGENVDYVLTIINQGSGTDTNVQLAVQLPESLEFVEANGKTEAQADGQTITFQPIETFAPGEEARFEVVAKANRAGQISTTAELTSDFLRVPAREAEPTVLIGGEGATNVQSSDPQQGQGAPNQGDQNQGDQGQASGGNTPNGGDNDN